MADNQRIDDLRRRVQKDPDSIAFAQLGEELRRAGCCDEAVEVCHAGLAIHPGYLSARVTLGRALLELNHLDAAFAEFAFVLKSAPENLAAIRGVAEVFHRRGELTEALEQYRSALVLAKNDPDLQQIVAELTKDVEPQKPTQVVDGLSLEQMQDELLKLAPPPATPAPTPQPPEAASTGPAATVDAAPEVEVPVDTVQSIDGAEHARARRQIAALERWLDATHVPRTDPGA